MTDIQRITLDEVVLHFAELEDPRSTVNRRHPLVSVVVIAVLAVLSGASGPTAIAEWAAAKEEFLVEALDPSLSTWEAVKNTGFLRKTVAENYGRRSQIAKNLGKSAILAC